MKYLIGGLLCLISINLKGQEMNRINQAVVQLFVATDQNNWEAVEGCFAEKVRLDYSSMGSNPAAVISPKEITSAWKGILPGFSQTHHQLGNFITTVNGSSAHVFCYGTATHYLEDEAGNIWTVVGSYDFDLEQQGEHWNITSMTFNFKYQDGNTSLAQKAIDKISGVEESISSEVSSNNKASVRAFFKALENENVDALVDLFSENAKHINPYHSGLFPEGASGKAGIRNYWTPVFPNFDGMTFPIEEIYAMEDPNIVFVKYKGNIKLKDNAGIYSNDYYSTFKFNEQGEITEYVEIFNPIVAARGFGLINKIK